MDAVSIKFVKKFSELKLGSPEAKLEAKKTDNDVLETTDIACVKNCLNQKLLTPYSGPSCINNEQLPVAKISIKENDRKPFCLSCSDDAFSNKPTCKLNEDVATKSFNPFIQSLVPRTPDRNGRKHCKSSPNHTIGNGKSAARQKTAVCASDTEILNCYGNSSSADFCAQLLHGSNGRFSEITPPMSKEISLKEIESCVNFIDDQFSPSFSISSSAYSLSSSSSIGNLSPNSVNSIESYSGDTRNPSPSISDLYPTPPSSVLQDVPLQTNDYFSESSPECSSLPFNLNDDSLIQFPFFDESLIWRDSQSPFSEKSEFDTFSSSSSQDTISNIVQYLKNGDVDPLTTQIVNRCSKSFDEATNRNCFRCDSAPASDKAIQKLDSLSNPLTSNDTTELSAQLSSNIMQPIYNSGNSPVQPTLLLMPVQLQTVTGLGVKDSRYQRKIKPNVALVEKRVDLPKNEERCLVVKDTGKINSVYPGKGEYKSVKAKICDTITREEKRELLKSALEERMTTDGSTKLHSSVISGNEKLVYIIVESMRTKIKTENLNSKTDNLNPRISATVKIQKFINKQDNLGCTPLYYAAFTENNLLVAYLLECGADPFIEDYKNGNTPYHLATLRGDGAIKLMELLSFKRNAADVTNKTGQTVLMAAVINHGRMFNGVQINGLKLIKHLLCSNHKLSPQDSAGRTALHIAVMKKDVELLEVLLTYGTDAGKARSIKNKEGNTILHDAALLANYRLIETIITRCSVLTEIRNNRGKLPYELINENRKPERELLRKKFDEYGYRNL